MRQLYFCLAGMVMMGLAGSGAPRTAGADDKPSAAAEALASLSRFDGEWTVKGRWSSGDSLEARSVYTWGLGKKILRTQTFVKNTDGSEYQRYEGIFAWHPKKKSLFQISFAYNGEMTETIAESKDKDTLLVGWTPFDESAPGKVRQTLTFTSQDEFLWKVELKEDDAWKTLIEATWHKKK
jgi:hypothetical protein